MLRYYVPLKEHIFIVITDFIFPTMKIYKTNKQNTIQGFLPVKWKANKTVTCEL